jgi:hypothetical protein
MNALAQLILFFVLLTMGWTANQLSSDKKPPLQYWKKLDSATNVMSRHMYEKLMAKKYLHCIDSLEQIKFP